MYGQVFLGDPPDALLRGMETGNAIMRETKAAIRPGVPAGDIHALVQRRLREEAGEAAQRTAGPPIPSASPSRRTGARGIFSA